MKGIVLKSFVARVRGNIVRGVEGHEIEVPKDVDWIASGLVEPLPDLVEPKRPRKKAPESTAIKPPEQAVQLDPELRALFDLVGEKPGKALKDAGFDTIDATLMAISAGKDLTEIQGIGKGTMAKLNALVTPEPIPHAVEAPGDKKLSTENI